MTRTRLRTFLVAFALVGLTGFWFAGTARAQYPSAPTNETTTSLGQFTISVAAPFQGIVSTEIANGDLPGFTWDAAHNLLTSPLLYDPSTTIGLSAATTVGAFQSSSGVQVGTGANSTTISPSTYSALPSGWTSAPGSTPEVITQMQSMNLTTAGLGGGSPGTSVVGGIANGLQVSPGQVQSTSSMGGDFPSKSFFDIFVDVNIGTTNLGTLTLENTAPLLVQASGLTSLPPTVIYTHTNSTPAPLVFTNGPYAGDTFGSIALAGHGAGYTNSQADQTSFENSYAAMYAAYIPELNPGSLASALTLLMGGVLSLTGRRPRD